MLPGQVIVGGCVSVTVTVKLQLLVLPDESHTWHVTLVTPLGKLEPLAGTQLVPATPQLSLTVRLKVTLELHWSVATGTVMLPGQVITGGSVSDRKSVV